MNKHVFSTSALLLCVLLTTPIQVYSETTIIHEAFPVFEAHTDGVVSMAFIDHARLISGGYDGMLRVSAIRSVHRDLLWEENLGFPIHAIAIPASDPSTFAHNAGLWEDPWSPHGISIRRSDDGVWLGDIRTADHGYPGNPSDLAYESLGYLLASAGSYLCIWRGGLGRARRGDELLYPHEYPELVGTPQYDSLALGDEQSLGPTAVAWSPDGIHLALGVRHRYVDGTLVRSLNIGQRPAGVYQSKSRAVYWDGRNTFGEPVASGLYFYTLSAGEFTVTRKMLIRK